MTRWSALKPSSRLRAVAVAVFVTGVVGACVLYWIETRSTGPAIDELLPGYSNNRERQVGILMGGLVVTLLEWLDALKDPGVQAAIVAAVAALAALICLRVATLLDRPPHDEPPRARAEEHR